MVKIIAEIIEEVLDNLFDLENASLYLRDRWNVDVSSKTLRHQIEKQVLRAYRSGHNWIVWREDLDRYAQDHAGKPGRKAGAR